ncbi:hypothetical protein [Egicoccus sp. AB-alg2]|uniref:hypothetical protein n=1 Tax=Egicoccus sp. AB-alg2 TaxID=3242693 RepID=UPI00359D2CEB
MTTVRSPRTPAAERRADVWRRWVAANALAELVGLSLAAGVAIMVAPWLDAGEPAPLFTATALVIAGGGLEGLVVGRLQWQVLCDPLPVLAAGRWVGATVLGAVLAWTLGMLPSTAMTLLDGGGGQAPAAAPFGAAVQYALAAVLGAVAGLVLGWPQARVLRGHVPRAGRWLLANAVAWAVAMPVIFLGIDLAFALRTLPARILVGMLTCLAAGAVAGAIHGRWLVRMTMGHDVPRRA